MSISGKYRYWLDIAGMSISGFCAIHCFLMPLLFMLLPLTNGLSHWVHTGLIFLVLPITLFTIRVEYLNQRSFPVIALLTLGLFLVSMGTFSEMIGWKFSAEGIITLLGSSLLITGHWLRKQQRVSLAVNKSF